jgi:magnesium transporter
LDIDVYLYDAAGRDERVELERVDVRRLDASKLLWVNVLRRDAPLIERAASRLQLENVPIKVMLEGSSRPRIDKFDGFFWFRINSVKTSEEDGPEKLPMDFIVGKNFVVTIHDEDVHYFEEFRQREKGETQFGELDAESFVATLLDLHVMSYFHALELIEKRVDKLDAKVLKKELEADEFATKMVDLRHDVAKLRRWLIPHRELFYTFLRGDFYQIAKSDSLDLYKTLVDHFENAIEAIESSRETVLSVFDLYATKSAQTMTLFIQRLTFLTLVTGSLSVITGVLGMNYKTGFFESEFGFWITISGLVLITIGLTAFARFRRWI